MLGETVVDAALAGEGTPGIAEYAVETLAATLGLSYAAGLRLVSEAVELCYRLPRLWALVQDGSVAGVEGPPGRRRDHHACRPRRSGSWTGTSP